MKITSSQLLIAAAGMSGLLGSAIAEEPKTQDYEYKLSPVVLWVGTQSAPPSFNYDATPGVAGLVLNAISFAKDMTSVVDRSNRLIYYKSVKPLLFGGPACQGPYEVPVVEGMDINKLLPGTVLNEENKTVQPVIGDDGQPIRITDQHPCYRVVVGKITMSAKQLQRSTDTTATGSQSAPADPQ